MNLVFEERQNGKQGTITLDGDLTVQRAEELRMLLIRGIIDADRVQVDFGPVTDADLSCLQLLCSAHRSAGRMQKDVSLSGAWPAAFTRVVDEAGYARLSGCKLDVNHTCLWVKR